MHVEVVEREALGVMVTRFSTHLSMVHQLLTWIVDPSSDNLQGIEV